jgi:hypothetical protein
MTTLKLLMLVFDERLRDLVEEVLAHQHVSGFSEIVGALGEGSHGRRFTSALYPGANDIILTVVTDVQVKPVSDALRAKVGSDALAGTDRVPIRIAVLPVDSFG